MLLTQIAILAAGLVVAENPEMVVLDAHQRAIRSLAFAADGKTLASSSWDNTVRIWRASARDPQKFLSHELAGSPSGVAFLAGDSVLATGGADASVHLWNVQRKPKAMATLSGHESRPFALASSPGGKMLVSGSGNPTMRLWKVSPSGDAEPWGVLANEEVPSVGISSLAFSGDGALLAAGCLAGKRTLRMWRIGSYLEEVTIPQAEAKLVAFAPKGHVLAFAASEPAIRLWDLSKSDAPRDLGVLKGHDGRPRESIVGLAYGPGGKVLASAGKDRKMILWDLTTRKQIHAWTFPVEPRALAWAPGERWLACGFANGAIILMDVRGKLPR